MTAPPATAQEGALTEWLLRGFALLAYGFAVLRIGHAWWAEPSRWTLLLLLLAEGYTLLLLLLARRAVARDMAPLAIAASCTAAFYFVLLDPDGTIQIVPEIIGIALQLTGLVFQVAAKVTLGRSFGLLPAQRGLVLNGPYRIVRHPIYFGYLVAHVGFLLVNFSWRNMAVIALLYVAQVYRIQREEAVLANSDAYREYQGQVRWRLLPLVY